MAKRIQFRAHGGPEVLEYVDYQPAAPGPNQVRVANKAIGLNFIDTYYRSGLYARQPCRPAWARRVPASSMRWAATSPGSRSATASPTAAARWVPTAICTPCPKPIW